MARTLVQITCNETETGEYVQTMVYYTGTLQPYFEYGQNPNYLYEAESTTVFSCSVFQLPPGTIVGEHCEPGRSGDAREALYRVRYLGESVLAVDAPEYDSPACPLRTCDVRIPGVNVTITQPSVVGGKGSVELRALTSRPPVTYLALGTQNTTGLTSGLFTDLDVGTYTFVAEDAAGCTVRVGPYVIGSYTGNPSGIYWLKYENTPLYEDPENPDSITGYIRNGTAYDFTTRLAFVTSETTPDPEAPFSRVITQLVDSYRLSDNITFRKVYHDGNGGLRFVDSPIPVGATNGTGLRFVNIIKTDVDELGTSTGAVLLEATNDGAGGLITYTRISTGEQTTTGSFAGLAAGTHAFRATDENGQSTEESILIEDRYRPKWRFLATDVFMEPLEVVVFKRDYEGEVARVCGDGQGEALTRSWDGQNDPMAELPELVGQGVTVVLRTDDALQFEELSTGDDRQHRVDVLGKDGKLEFRGYASPDLFRVAVHEGLPSITINASCGLGSLRDTLFLDHIGRDITESGRWPLLHTLLHCLSRCDVNLPVYVGIQLREELMEPSEETLSAILASRAAYGEQPVLSEVVEAILRPSKAVVWQARGAWWVASELDLALLDDAKWTHYDMSGQSLLPSLPTEGLDLWAIKYPGTLSNARHLVWVAPGAEQATVAAAKLVQATVKLQLRENNLPGGDLQTWDADGTLPVPAWGEGPAKQVMGPKAGTSALELMVFNVLTAPMRTYPAPDYAPILLKLKARSLGVKPTTGPTPTATLQVEVLTDGIPDPQLLTFLIPHGGPDSKFEEYSSTLPADTTGKTVRLRISATGFAPVELAQVFLSILPSLVEWPEQDQVTVLRPDGVLKAPDVQLVHADAPRLNVAAPIQKMDVLAWNHALSLADGTPTSSWTRPGARQPAPLLETAALDRLELRQTAQRTLSGTVLGYAGVGALSFGQRVLSPDAPGRLLMVVSCELQQISGQARVTLRAIGQAPDFDLPLGSRVTTAGVVRTLRNGVIRVVV